jgi:predicted metal-dependent phosphotriesterase family hydrolase
MTILQTLRGLVNLDQLGQTMIHEHVFWGHWGDEQWRKASVAFAQQELRKLIAHRARTLVDVGPHTARNLAWYRDLGQLDLNIILYTGFYLDSLTPRELRDLSEDAYVERFTGKLTSRIGEAVPVQRS